MVGIIVYAFAWRRHGHSPCNVRLALAALRIAAYQRSTQRGPVIIMAQRTVAHVMQGLQTFPYVVQKFPGYEGSEEATRQAAELFSRLGITEVIPVAQPVFQLSKCIHLVRHAGFSTPSYAKLASMIGWIGFDPQSVQPATRDPFSLVFYTGRQILTGYRPPVEQSEP